MAGEDSRGILPGYVALPSAGDVYARADRVAAVRIDGPFLVRGKTSVEHVKDGWLVKGADGYLFGLEHADFAQRFTYFGNNPPNNLFGGVVYGLGQMTEGVALADYVVTSPLGNPGATIASIAKTFGDLPTGTTFVGSTPTSPTITGTPGAGTGSTLYYFELTSLWDDGASVLSRYVFGVDPPGA
jgi:hypothetical protein